MSYRKFNTITNDICRECHCHPSMFSPIVDLGYSTAEERINSIMQAGQVLERAKESMYAYRASETPLGGFDDNVDPCTIMYGDSMDVLDMAETLGQRMYSAMQNASAVEASQTYENAHSEVETPKDDKDVKND